LNYDNFEGYILNPEPPVKYFKKKRPWDERKGMSLSDESKNLKKYIRRKAQLLFLLKNME